MNKWLYLDGYVEITFSHNKKECLLVNTLDSKKYILTNSDYQVIKKIHANEYSIKLTDNDCKDLNHLIKLFEDNSIGGLEESNDKPFIFYPIINIQRDIRKFKNLSYRDQGYNTLENLFELSVHIDGKNILLSDQILKLVYESEHSSIAKINLHITNFNSNKVEITEFINNLNSVAKHCSINISIDHTEYFAFSESIKDSQELVKNNISVLVDNQSFNKEILKEKGVDILFKISNESQYNHYSNFVVNSHIDYNFHLDIKNCNTDFLKEFVFLNKDEILDKIITKQNYDANKTLNKALFGKLVIKNNKVYNCETKGKVIAKLEDNKTLKELIYRALVDNNEWFLTRNKVKPCKGCIFKNTCPPITDYELEATQYNFCTV